MNEAIEQEALQAPSIREALTAAVEQTRDETVQPAAESSAERAERLRDEQGRFAKTEAPVAATPEQFQPADLAPQRPPRPSSWKKEYEEKWGSIDPDLQKYIHQRESEFATGVSTYKAEAESARALKQAIEPFMPNLQRHNIDPVNWIQNLGHAHQVLSLGSPQQKLQLFSQLARDYGIDARHLVSDDGSQPQPIVDQNTAWLQQQLQQQAAELQSIQQFMTRQQQAEQQALVQEVEKFRTDTEKYPHFETVRETMAGLLQSGLAQDLSSAYDKAIRMHDDLWQSQQEAQRANAEAERQRAAADAAKSARAKVASVKSASPSAIPGAPSSGKGRREILQEALSSVGSGRV